MYITCIYTIIIYLYSSIMVSYKIFLEFRVLKFRTNKTKVFHKKLWLGASVVAKIFIDIKKELDIDGFGVEL